MIPERAPRTDTDMYDHFLYFAGGTHDTRRAELRQIWQALCAQENAGGEYTLDDEVVPYLESW
jgi:hypothetical protein